MASDSIGEAYHWTGEDDQPIASADEQRTVELEQDWYHLMASARDFALKYGADKMLRCVGDVFADQPNLFRG